MYPLLIAGGVGSAIMLSMVLIPKDPWFLSGPFFGMAIFVAIFMLLQRKVGDKLAPLLEQAQRQAQSGNVPQAIQSFEKVLEWKKWQLFLDKQINNQIGTLHYASGDEKKAAEFLRNGYPKVSEGHLVLSAILYREKKFDEACEVLDLGIRFNRKSAILYNVLAWLQHQEGHTADAIATLERCLKKLKADDETSGNLERLRSDKKMNMKGFGQHWFMLKFEIPKGMGVGAAPLRKGFRQPAKGAGRQKRKGKRKKNLGH
jgi:tetratricopeptide (TPR) repeat protein